MVTENYWQLILATTTFLAIAPIVAEGSKATSKEQAGLELAAQISGQAAGAITFHVLSCAELDPKISDTQREAARRELAAERAQFAEAAEVWDEAFEAGHAQAAGERLNYDMERCADALKFLRSK